MECTLSQILSLQTLRVLVYIFLFGTVASKLIVQLNTYVFHVARTTFIVNVLNRATIHIYSTHVHKKTKTETTRRHMNPKQFHSRQGNDPFSTRFQERTKDYNGLAHSPFASPSYCSYLSQYSFQDKVKLEQVPTCFSHIGKKWFNFAQEKST